MRTAEIILKSLFKTPVVHKMATRRINFEDMRDAQKMPHSQSTQSQFYETNTQHDRRNQEQKIGAIVFSSGAFPPKNSKLATLHKKPASI